MIFCLLQALIRIHFELRQQQVTVEMEVPCVHFVETSTSLLQEMPWLIHRDYNVMLKYLVSVNNLTLGGG